MARTPSNKLNASIDAVVLAAVYALFDNLDTTLPFLEELTEEDVKKMPKASTINRDYIRDVLNALQSIGTPISPLIDANAIERDLLLQEQLNKIILRAEQFLKKLKDTAMLAGSEAYAASLQAYSIIDAKANIGEPNYGALRTRLSSRFATGKRKKKDEASTKKTEAGASDDKK